MGFSSVQSLQRRGCPPIYTYVWPPPRALLLGSVATRTLLRMHDAQRAGGRRTTTAAIASCSGSCLAPAGGAAIDPDRPGPGPLGPPPAGRVRAAASIALRASQVARHTAGHLLPVCLRVYMEEEDL
jgi:hypothetical protein